MDTIVVKINLILCIKHIYRVIGLMVIIIPFQSPIIHVIVVMFQANDALHLSMLDGCDISIDLLGDVILQDTFHVWDPKKLIRQSRERRMFLFELYMVFSKEVKDSNGKAKYQYKMKMMVRMKIIQLPMV